MGHVDEKQNINSFCTEMNDCLYKTEKPLHYDLNTIENKKEEKRVR